MPVTTQAALIEALALGRDEQIIGTAESEWVEFKSQPYPTATPKGRRDLISDVCSFANHRGGVIVFPVKTLKHEQSRAELADKVRTVEDARVDDDQIRALVRAHVHPLVHVDVRCYARGNGASIVAIVVESQQDFDKPFIVDLIAADDDAREIPHAVGLPTRHGADTHWMPAPRLQQLVSQGLRAQTETSISGPSELDEEATAHVDMILRHEPFQRWARLIVQAVPERAHEVADFYGSFQRDLAQRRDIRDRGFGLRIREDRLEPRGTSLVRLREDHVLMISRSGVVTAAAMGSPEFLGWASKSPEKAVIANPFPMVEFPSETVRLAHEAVGPAIGAMRWTFNIIAEGLKYPTALLLRPSPSRLTVGYVVQPATNSFRRSVVSVGELWRDAFNVVAEVYGTGYGLGRDRIPFATDERIDLRLMDA